MRFLFLFSWLVLNENDKDIGKDEQGQDGEPLFESPAEAGDGLDFHDIRRMRGTESNSPALFFQALRTKTCSPVGRTPTEKSAIVPHPVDSEPYSFLSSAMMEERYCSTAQMWIASPLSS